jgi:hypothetical protein
MERTPLRIGVFLDFPQGDGGAATEEALRLGFDEVARAGRLDRDVELVVHAVRGLPMGSWRPPGACSLSGRRSATTR